MNAESLTFVPDDWSTTAARCAAAMSFIDKIPDGVVVSPEQDIRSLLLVRHNGPGESWGGTPEQPVLWPAFYYLLQAGCNEQKILEVMDVHSQPKLPEFTHVPDIYRLSLDELQTLLESRLAPWYALANDSLNNDSSNGFNRHGLEDHVAIVAKGTVKLLADLGYSVEVQKIALIMAYGHDLGNVLSRKQHSLIAPYILERYMPELKQNPEKWAEICLGMQLHNEPVIMRYLESRGDRNDFSSISPATLSLITNDKVHVSPVRVSDKVIDIERFLDTDPHFAVNMLLETTFAGLTPEGAFLWRMEFQPTLSTEEQKRSLDRLKRNTESDTKGKKFVPKWMHEAHQKFGTPHAYSIDAQLWKIYIERNILAIQSIFQLGPNIPNVIVEMYDPNDGITIRHEFTRENKDQLIASYLKIFGSK